MERIANQRRKQGFSLAETLLAVAILIILFGLAAPNVFQMQKSLRQKELDEKAEIIYIAAQNRLTRLRTSGRSERYSSRSAASGEHTITLSEENYLDEYGQPQTRTTKLHLYYVQRDDLGGGGAADAIMEPGVVDDELRGNRWIIEYQPETGLVYSVFYSETAGRLGDYVSPFIGKYHPDVESYPQSLRLRTNRMKDGARIGYYAGPVGKTSPSSTIKPTITVTNEEKLMVVLKCAVPVDGADLIFHFTMTDQAGNRYEKHFKSTDGMQTWGQIRSITLVLDDLSRPETRFGALYGDGGSMHSALVPGTPLHLTLQVYSENNLIERSKVVTADTNSLFADSSTVDQAQIKYGRHLQNLDASSGVSSDVTSAQQADHLSFADSASDRDWYSYYSASFFNGTAHAEANFKPIVNPNLTAFDGNGFIIASLNADTGSAVGEDGRAGLFRDTNPGMAFTNVTLTGPRVKGDTVGALTGAVTGSGVTVDNCKVYLTESDLNGKTQQDVWLSGSTTGGLAGRVESGGGLSVTNSFASAVLEGRQIAGGLVGSVAAGGALDLSLSYADSYLTGADTGALVGGGKTDSISDCYAAGFQTSTSSSAGLVNGEIGALTRSYTISYMNKSEDGDDSYQRFSTARTMTDLENQPPVQTYYFSGSTSLELNIAGTNPMSGWTSQDLLERLKRPGDDSNAFTAETVGHTVPYNLDGKARDSYEYPRLSVNDHYGDWQADFRPGALVYYERYADADREYGFYGANLESTLTEEGTITGDGYGLIYKAGDAIPYELTMLLDDLELALNLSQNQNQQQNQGQVLDPNQNQNQTESTVTYTLNGVTQTKTINRYTVTGADGDYVIYALPMELVNLEQPDSFYHKVTLRSRQSSEDPLSAAYCYFNPRFAKTVGTLPDDQTAVPAAPDQNLVSIRSPRHLYSLSLYYDSKLRSTTLDSTFRQERDIRYTGYDWEHFYRSEPDFDPDADNGAGAGVDRWTKTVTGGLSSYVIDAQFPIGRTEDASFHARYNGQCYTITDLSFKSVDGKQIGMFGNNEGTLQNVVLLTEFDPKNESPRYLVQREQDMGANDFISMGVLAGINQTGGQITNCAVAGYYVAGSDGTIHAYDNSKVYVGGLVGENLGVITNSAADTPAIRLSTVFAEAYAGGFVGWNRGNGTISNCYDLGHVEVAYARGGSVSIAGFAGQNLGSLNQCYCATSLVASGDVVSTHCFSPKSGSVSNCTYLDKGTYSYIGTLRSYNGNSNTYGASIDYDALHATRNIRGARNAYRCICHPNTKETLYPYRAVVRNRQNLYVHYGDWQVAPVLGTLGVFYWEREENGSNNGYHFTYLGTNEGETDYGTSLCTAHDDHGEITEYGYGYYVQQGQESSVKLESTGISVSNPEAYGSPGTYNSAAKAALEEQMKGYVFYPYTTRVSSGEDHVYLSRTDGGRDGVWKLTYNGSEGTKSYQYRLTPFFANAMCRVDGSLDHILVEASDGRKTNYAKTPGTGDNASISSWENDDKWGNAYEIRSVQQLAYINWNYESQNCNTLVYAETTGSDTSVEGVAGSGNYQKFPYLQYATKLSKGKQARGPVENARPSQTWIQTHDLEGADYTGYTPIAGMATSTPVSNGSYVNLLFAWFGGNYDGQSYKIQNLDVISESFAVGLFGVTVGADIQNIILYSDRADGRQAVVQRATLGKTAVEVGGATINFQEQAGAYNLGGMIGIAYEYMTGDPITNKISNCAIAGYSVIDSSTNRQGAGTANVGGLVGLANVNLERCSSTADILIDATFRYGYAAWGSYFRVGGLAGSAGAPGQKLLSVRDSYTGGSISVSQRTLEDTPTPRTSGGFVIRDHDGVGYSSHIFISGVIGGSYSPNFSNFTSETSNSPDGKAVIENCYTYIQLPNLEGNIRAISLFANQGDRYNRKTHLTVTNCFYLDSIRDSIGHPDRDNPATWPAYFFESTEGLTDNGSLPTAAEWELMLAGKQTLIDYYKVRVISEEEFQKMLDGDLFCLTKYLKPQNQGSNQGRVPDPADPLTYSQLSGATPVDAKTGKMILAQLGVDAWGMVTTREPNGARINGKYSFPSTDLLEGKNFPFPTVIRQNDLAYGTFTHRQIVNVHYGPWPTTGMRWTKARDKMDLFADMTEDSSDENYGFAVHTFLLQNKGVLGSGSLTPDSFDLSVPGIVEVLDVNYQSSVEYGGKRYQDCFLVRMKALKTGALTVRLKDELNLSTNPSFVLEVTGEMAITTQPEALETFKSQAQPVELIARAAQDESKLYSDRGTWTLAAARSGEEDLFTLEPDSPGSHLWNVTSWQPGTRSLEATFTILYNSQAYTSSQFLTVKTYGVLGLVSSTAGSSNETTPEGDPDTDQVSWNEAPRSNTGNQTGGDPNPPYASEDAPALPAGYQLALYGTLDDGVIPEGQRQMYVQDSPVMENGETEDGRFRLVSEARSNDSRFDYLPFTLRLSDNCSLSQLNQPITPIVVKAVITDPIWSSVTYTLEAKLHELELFRAAYEIGFDDPDEQSAMDPDYTYYPQRVTIALPLCEYRREHYVFAGWKTKAGDQVYDPTTDLNDLENAQPLDPERIYQPGERVLLGTDTVFVAQWREVEYTVQFNPNAPAGQVEGTMEPMTLRYSQQKALDPCAFTRPGHRFLGWNTSPRGTGMAFADEQEVAKLTETDGGTVTLYAQWEIDSYTVQFNANAPAGEAEGSMENQTFRYGEAQALTSLGFTRTGYTFLRWNTAEDGSGETSYDDAQEITLALAPDQNGAVIHLYAQWQAHAYTVHFDPNAPEGCTVNGSTDSQAFTYGETKALTDNGFTLDSWHFTGWNTAADGSGESYADKASVSNLTAEDGGTANLYAQWEQIRYLTMRANGTDTAIPTYQLRGETGIPGYGKPTKPDGEDSDHHTITYELMGWYSAYDGTGALVLDADGSVAADVEGYTADGKLRIAGDKTLYARWAETTWLRTDFDPATITGNKARKWSDSVSGISFAQGDYLEAVIDLTGCHDPDPEVISQNILSFGFGNKLDVFSDSNTIHVYYPGNPKKPVEEPDPDYQHHLRLFGHNCFNTYVDGKILMRFSNEEFKFYQYGTETVLLSLTNQSPNIANVRNRTSTFYVGSQEGGNRSYATYDYIKVVRYSAGIYG